MKHNNTAKTLAIAGAMVLVLGIAPAVKAADKGCTNASLKGTFSHMGTGFITGVRPLAGVGTDTFDGNGGITGTASLSINGTIASVTETGTYTVNPDCTGTYTVSSAGGSTTAFFVIDDGGNEVKAVCTDPGSVITHIFRRQFPEGDWRQ
jgi:hypothetical protein